MQDKKAMFSIEQAPNPGQTAIHALPVQFTLLIGREQDTAAICALLQRQEVRLLTLVGTGGVGKTRLAIQVAQQMREHLVNGVCFVGLAAISDTAQVIPALAEELGIQETGAFPLFDLVKATLHAKHCLLLLDNFEQVLEAASLLEELLTACPSLKILVTSRAALHLRAAYTFPVSPLALPDLTHLPESDRLSAYGAVALFVERAQARLPAFRLTQENAHAISELCVRLDGLPLAIELAASRIALLPPQALLARLSQRFQLLTGGARTLPARQHTLHNTLQWSYDLLTTQEQHLFSRLCVFVGGFTLEGAEAVSKLSFEIDLEAVPTLDVVASLLDKSFLLQGKQEDEEPRLLMLETIREYGLELLTSSGERQAAQRAHADYYLWLSEEVEPQSWGHQQGRWLQKLEQEHGNLQAALRWFLEQGDAPQSIEKALRLGAALRSFWLDRGYYSEGRTFLEQVLARSEGIEASVRAKGLWAVTTMAHFQGDNDRAEALSKESLTLCRELGDRRGIAYALYYLGVTSACRGDYTAARQLSEEALALRRELGNKHDIAWSLTLLASVVSDQGEYSRGRALREESLTLFRELGNIGGIALALLDLAWLLFFSQSDSETISSLLEEGFALQKELDDKPSIGVFLILAGELALSQEDASTARSLAEKSVMLTREIGDRLHTAQSLALLAKVIALQGDQAVARAMYEESLALAKAGNSKWHIARGLEGLAGVLASQGNLVWAARLWGAAEALRDAMGTPIAPVYRAEYERSVTAARARLGEPVFTIAWTEGRSMTPEQVLGAPGQAAVSTQISAGKPAIPTTKSLPRYPAGLTVREVEVLCLVAQGLTDAQVAEQLIISPHTVNAHLKSIYGKIWVSSRNAATRYTLEHHLL